MLTSALVLALSSCFVPASPPVQDPGGHWKGAIEAGGRGIATWVHLSKAQSGWTGTVDSPEQATFGLPLADLVVEGPRLEFRVPDTQGAFAGAIESDADGAVLRGTWRQGGAEFPLVLRPAPVDPLVGTWSGTLAVSGVKLRFVFHVGTHEDGSLGGSMISPDQSPARIALSTVESGDDGSVRLVLSAGGASYEGRREGDAITGKFRQGPIDVELSLARSGPPAPRRRPQTPRAPFPYRSEDVRYPNTEGGLELAGTLTLPEGEGPFPAVLLITGSGAQDRDETLFEHKPFAVLADALTRAGVAVLRVDDRGVGGTTGSMATATSADFATDVSAGVDFLRSRGEIDAERIGLAGHSEGGLIAPMVAAQRGDIAFLVLLAGPGTTGERILLRQAALINEASGAPPEAVEQNRAVQEMLFDVLRSTEDVEAARAKMKEELVRLTVEAGGDANSPQIQTQVAQVSSPWFRYFLFHDPAPVLEEVRCPVLALNGALDLQVPGEENLGAIREALLAGGNEDVDTILYPGLNHLFQHCTKGTPDEYAEIEETFSEEVLAKIVAWVGERTRPQ